MNSVRYSRLDNDDDNEGASQILLSQDRILQDQEDELEEVGKYVRNLKGMSHRIGEELDTQAIMLDDLGNEMENVDSKLDTVMKKMQKLTNLEDDGRQWKVIFFLCILLFFLVFLLIIL